MESITGALEMQTGKIDGSIPQRSWDLVGTTTWFAKTFLNSHSITSSKSQSNLALICWGGLPDDCMYHFLTRFRGVEDMCSTCYDLGPRAIKKGRSKDNQIFV
eukprot:3316423-Amphidinium_carterae.1